MFKLLNKNHAVEHYWRGGGVLYRKSSEEGSLYTTSVQLISTALFLRIPKKKYCRCKISCKLIYFYVSRHLFSPYSELSLLSFMLQFVRIFFILMQSVSLFKIDILFILYTYISYKHLHFYQSVLISCCNLMSQLL